MALYYFSISILFSLTLLTTPTLSLFEPDPDSTPTVYDLLPKYGLPSGLLPDSVTNFTLSDDGRFVVYLPKPCTIEFDYLVYYEKTISGRIGYGSITDLKGIQVKRFFVWFDVDEIKVDLPPNDSIYFKVGFINKKLDIDQFKTVRSCGDDGVSGSCGGSWKSFLQESQELAERVMITRLHLYGKWIKKCDHGKIYQDISDENLALMRERLMETVIWPSDDSNSEVIS